MIPRDIKSDSSKKINMRALVLGLILLALTGICLGVVLLTPKQTDGQLIARIYQSGTLFKTIDLSAVAECYSFQVNAPDGGYNIIEVRPGSIGMTEADCPDGLCVEMGYSTNALLPIVCLPHELVIEITKAAPAGEADTAPDIITY